MNAGKIASVGALGALGGYLSGLNYGMGLLGAGVVLMVFAAAIAGWEEIKSKGD